MKSPLKMYHLKPVVVHDFPVDIPNCMYKLNNIHKSEVKSTEGHHVVPSPEKKLDIFDQVKRFLKNCQGVQGMAELEAKQTDILKQLVQLKQEIVNLKKELIIQNELVSEEPVTKAHRVQPVIINLLPDELVIQVNPLNPPYSIAVFQRLLQGKMELRVLSFLHSSVSALPDSANQLIETLQNFNSGAKGVPVVNVKLIWKKINSNSEFLLGYTPVSGEVNLLRYLYRSIYGNENDTDSFEIDSLLDQCYLLFRAKTKSEKTNILQVFNKSLSKNEWLAGKSEIGVADLAAYSAIKQCSISNELAVNLDKWYKKCEILAFQ